MRMIEKIKAKARANVKRIVLPEGDEPRTIEAAETIRREGIAEPILISGDFARTKADEYAAALYELRKAKGLTEEGAAKLVADPMYYGMMMVKQGDADGLVSGAIHSTGDMLRPALQIVKTRPGMKLVSSSFLMECPDRSLGEDGLLVYADCVVNPCPNAEELAHIAIASAETARTLCGKVDAILLTGGLLRFPDVEETIRKRCGFIAPIASYPGEMEQEAMALPTLKALRGELEPLTYTGRNVWDGFADIGL